MQRACTAEPLAPLFNTDGMLLQAIEQSGLWDLLPGGRTEEGSSSPYGQYTPRSLQGASAGQCPAAEQFTQLLGTQSAGSQHMPAAPRLTPFLCTDGLVLFVCRQDAVHGVPDVA